VNAFRKDNQNSDSIEREKPFLTIKGQLLSLKAKYFINYQLSKKSFINNKNSKHRIKFELSASAAFR
jgi:hypothetical protein